ncbi:MAG: hypothetical protein ACREDR_10210 [Blastocatellia bacterium]
MIIRFAMSAGLLVAACTLGQAPASSFGSNGEDTAGLLHTPGHTSYIVESKGQALIVMGDLVLMGALQFENPSLGSSFDGDPKFAAEQRLRVFKMAADKNIWVAGGHLSFPGIGHIRSVQDRYFWIPANYAIPH